MSFNFENLDKTTREFMLEEVELDLSADNLYMSKRFEENNLDRYFEALKESVTNGTEVSLAETLRTGEYFKSHEERNVKGKIVTAKIPANAADLFAQGEFNRFYLRGLCLRAIEEKKTIQIYRARLSSNPRQESEALVGDQLDPERLLLDLRENIGVDTILGLPPGPNSGLSGRLT